MTTKPASSTDSNRVESVTTAPLATAMQMLPTTGGWYCPKCGVTTPVGNVHHCGSAPGGSWTAQPVLQGWQCPVCGVVYAPTVPNCHNTHQPPPRITTGANDD